MTKIMEIKKLKRLYLVRFDSDFERLDGEIADKLYVTEDTVVKFMLSKGTALDKEGLGELERFANFSRGKSRALYYLSFKSRTRAEVAKYLVEHEIPEADIEKVLAELEAQDFINDTRYAESYIEGRMLSGKVGPYVIRQKLLQKGIERELVAETLEALFDEEKQTDVAVALAQKLAAIDSARMPLRTLKNKIQRSLVRKGFSYEIARTALERIALEADESNEAELIVLEAEKVYARLAKRYEGYDLRQRVAAALARKGFDWDAIGEALKEYDF